MVVASVYTVFSITTIWMTHGLNDSTVTNNVVPMGID